ncbi:PhoX family protein [Muricoccus radiodurans]|uniref:PhoX family protein n=1 Tax=Muricoccus radiodurans TaxID=2231721 RepID=UPI003CF30E92
MGEIEDIGSNPSPRDPIRAVIRRRMTRRAALRGLTGAAAGAVLAQDLVGEALAQVASAVPASGLAFPEVAHQDSKSPGQAAPEGYEIQTVIRWGDPVLADAPAFDPASQSAASQAAQFGYNNDYLDFFPLPKGSGSSDRGLLVVNHEYSNTNLMFPGIGEGRGARLRSNAEQVAVEMCAHGMSVVEVARRGGTWVSVPGGAQNRRITMHTPMRVSGPAAGHPRLRTNADPTGMRVLGTLNNCAGGNTPWGTVLTAEENINYYFGGEAAEAGEQRAHYRRYGIIKDSQYAWRRFEARFDLDQEPNEPNRFGWVVEFDPYDPNSVPVKRTAMGRFKHEGATHAVSADGRVAFYMGDDERNEYVYRFVTARPWNRDDPAANRDLLDEGTLSVARFHDDGRMEWLPLAHGTGPLTEANGFANQADVVIEARRAADLLGATPMDRPEDVETNPVNGRVYAMLTNNNRRTAERARGPNPRADNRHGQVLEIIPPGAGTDRVDHAASEGRWELFLVAGDPKRHTGASYHQGITENGWLTCPDNVTFDSKGRIWISTDSSEVGGITDGIWAAETAGPVRGLTRCFYQAPAGAEVCGPRFTPDNRTLFLAIQHPGEGRGSTFETPSTRWPDFVEGMPPRPSIIAIVKRDGGEIGS